MQSKRIGVIMGGTSAERDISLASGRAVAAALSDAGHDVVPLVLGDGRSALRKLMGVRLDAAFLALHGRLGEDGCVQGALEMLGVPYTGSSVLGSALAMDKVKAKELFRLHNVPTPPYYTVDEGVEGLAALHGNFGFPAVVKPRREGSSIGLRKVTGLSGLEQAVSEARQHDDAVLVERFVAAREIAVGILHGRVLGAIEIAPKDGLYDYTAKYTQGATEYYLPARLPATRLTGVLNLAERAAEAVGATSAVRVDLLVTEGMNEYVLEVNTLPGMTETSLLPKIAEAAGFSFAGLCESIVAGARLHTGAAPAAVESGLAKVAPGEVFVDQLDVAI